MEKHLFDAIEAMDRVQPLASDDVCRNYHGGNPESEAANAATDKQRDRARVLGQLKMRDMTCDELEVALGMRHQTCSARVADLKKEGRIVPTGLKRKTRTGCNAAVLRLRTPEHREA